MISNIKLSHLLIDNAEKLKYSSVDKILLLCEFKKFIIGDSCDRLTRIQVCHELFPKSIIDFHCNQHGFSHLVKDNPYLSKCWFGDSWNDIDFLKYDLVVCVSYNEQILLEYLESRYKDTILLNEFGLAVLGAHKLFDVSEEVSFVFPPFHLYYATEFASKELLKNRLYASDDERIWGTQWLSDNGVNANDCLIICVDNSNSRARILPLDVYFEVLDFFLQLPHIKILVFDENGTGKKKFYEAWLGQRKAERLIFAERTNLRESMCIISSPLVKLIFGPCTGIMHCASGIYAEISRRKDSKTEVPVIMVYRGILKGTGDNPYRWWGNTDVDCVLIKSDKTGRKQAKLLCEEDSDINVALNGLLDVNEFSAEILTRFITDRYGDTIFNLRSRKF